VNFAESYYAALRNRHYFIHAGGHRRRWASFSTARLGRYRERWNDDFFLVIVGDTSEPDDFYAIPWSQITNLFIDPNVYPSMRDG
jgi:hypothetical protein